jgi:hypothetical protein
MKLALAFGVGLFSTIPSAQAADVALDDFYGCWVGEGIAKTETVNVR